MLTFWKKKKQAPSPSSPEKDNSTVPGGNLPWNTAAKQAMDQATSSAPVPAMLKGRLKKELRKAAEDAARTAGHTEVTAEDLMHGLMSRLPENMRGQFEDAIKQGPEGLKNLEKRLKRK
ncbi:MAG: PCP reductase family protein [Acidobacteriota bacterium]